MRKPWSRLTGLLDAANLCGGALVPTAAYAWGHGGWGWGGGGWGCCARGGVYFGFAPPIYIGPPVVYAGPPVVYAPPPGYAVPAPGPAPIGQSCYAGAYICPLDNPGPVGSPCTCPTNTGRVQGAIR